MSRLSITLLVTILHLGILSAEVKDAGPGGFNIGFTLEVNAKPDDVYIKLVDDVQAWWDPDHT
ncbi:MAG TPA: hypothetical protein VMY18_07300, partial [Acidobacteriota bacterium]|nr:hypothetical protein [Acidobacteriota bacterium]